MTEVIDQWPIQTEIEQRFPVKVVEVAGDKGPCGGVNMAIDTTFDVLRMVDGREPVYANNHPVHNELISQDFTRQGLVIQPNITLVPDGSILIASAHGWPLEDKELAHRKDLLIIDTTCQLVSKVNRGAERAVREGKHVIYVGAKNHPEPRGVLGGLPEGTYTFIDIDEDLPDLEGLDDSELAVLNQTTLSTVGVMEKIEKLRRKYPELDIPNPVGICYATDNRQNAVRQRLQDNDQPHINALVVVGSKKSHNSNELRDVGLNEFGIPSYLIDQPGEIDDSWFDQNTRRVLVTSGASVLPIYLRAVIKYFTDQGAYIRNLPRTEKDLTFVAPDLETLKRRYQTE